MILIRYAMWALMLAMAVLCVQWAQPWAAIAIWSGVAALLCGVSAGALASQPLGKSHFAGLLASRILKWGYAVSGGQLPGVILVSWLVWMIVGSCTIGLVTYRGQIKHQLLILSLALDSLALLYVLGILIKNRAARNMPASLLKVSCVLVAMILSASLLWAIGRSSAAITRALLIAGGPVALIGGGYGIFILLMLTVGRKARWN